MRNKGRIRRENTHLLTYTIIKMTTPPNLLAAYNTSDAANAARLQHHERTNGAPLPCMVGPEISSNPGAFLAPNGSVRV